MSFVYKSRRVGKNGKEFWMWKVKTLVDGTDKTSSFAKDEQYTRFGRLLRRFKLDEFLQFYNVLRGEMSIFGWRPVEAKSYRIIPIDVREKLFSTKPGIIDIASLYFYDEEKILQLSLDPYKDYWKKIFPQKLALQLFYIEHRCWLLNLALVYMVLKRMIKELFYG